MKVLLFCPTYRFEPETREAIFSQEWDGALDFLFTRDNPHPQGDGGRANILHNYQKGRAVFLRGDWDAMFVVESDIIPPDDALLKLAATGADVAYGLYLYRRGWPRHVNVYRHVTGPYPDQPLSLFADEYRQAWGRVVKCSGAGLGCVLIRRVVLERVAFRSDGDKSHCDSAFTRDVWRAGFGMKADMTVICGHKLPDGTILYPVLDGVAAWAEGETDGYRGVVT